MLLSSIASENNAQWSREAVSSTEGKMGTKPTTRPESHTADCEYEMDGEAMSYVIAVQAAAYRLNDREFAMESAYSHHVTQLKKTIDPKFKQIIIIAPAMSESNYQMNSASLGILNSRDGVFFVAAHPDSVSVVAFWARHAARILREIKRSLGNAGIVHSGMSSDIWRPLMAMVNFTAWWLGKPVLFIVDIDFRLHTWRSRRLGIWSMKNYLTNRLFHDPLRWMQLWLAPRMFDLVLLKSPALVRDFGRGRPHVKNFLDTAHSCEHVLSECELRLHLERVRHPEAPLTIVYFGRLVAYKGLDKIIEAVQIARAAGHDIRLTIIGDGPCREDLRRQADDAGLNRAVAILPAVMYGEPLFHLLSGCHLSVAAPLREDTPRAAFDSMARGLPVVAFDIAYFVSLAELSGAVSLAKWPEPQSLAREIVALDEDRDRLAAMSRSAVTFARANTQEIWLDRRRSWTLEHIIDPTKPELAKRSRH
jgi:glycosyltransferase involved in cell wall biosynthesis